MLLASLSEVPCDSPICGMLLSASLPPIASSLGTPHDWARALAFASPCRSTTTMITGEELLFSADCKRGRRKGATSKIAKNRQKVSKSFSTIFAPGKNRQKLSKSVKKFFDTFHTHKGDREKLTESQVFRVFSVLFSAIVRECLGCFSLSPLWVSPLNPSKLCQGEKNPLP